MAVPIARNAPAGSPRLPRRTARLRLTALYGGLFLACGAVLLTVSYVLVQQAIAPSGEVNEGGFGQVRIPAGLITVPQGSRTLAPSQVSLLMLTLGKEITTIDLRQVLIDAPIALGIVTLVALALGWLVAGRVLRPLAVITATARRISASSLDQRLQVRGPDDELKALSDTLNELFARLQTAFEAQRHFVANASHELRTPLTRERAMLQVALDDPATTAQDWRCVAADVLASNTEQEHLIEALLTLAASESGLDRHESVDLAAVTQAALLSVGPEVNRTDLSLDVITEPARLFGDRLLVERLAVNLVGNAVRHNIVGGKLQIRTATRDGSAVLAVANTGPVIEPEVVGRLFQPFLRLEGRVHRESGHGLGLSIVRAIAIAHGAAITARARRGGGLAIEVAFPASVGPRQPRPCCADDEFGQEGRSGQPAASNTAMGSR
ncbi:MAG TPA: ATP-binding protein [Streptosporangiaceae bacterium]